MFSFFPAFTGNIYIVRNTVSPFLLISQKIISTLNLILSLDIWDLLWFTSHNLWKADVMYQAQFSNKWMKNSIRIAFSKFLQFFACWPKPHSIARKKLFAKTKSWKNYFWIFRNSSEKWRKKKKFNQFTLWNVTINKATIPRQKKTQKHSNFHGGDQF